ncbi:MAG: manganese transporter [Planctomyces sp.]|nr:manganese transporter [Planctomyces sp.]
MMVDRILSRREVMGLLLTMSGCASSAPNASGSRTAAVVATTGMVGDLVQFLTPPDLGRVAVLIRPGVDPHLYRATRADLLKVFDARLVFYSGLHLEGRMDALFERANRPGRPSLPVTSQIPHEELIFPDDGFDRPDPHVWMDVGLWRSTVPVMVGGLSQAFPQFQTHFAERAQVLEPLLDRLNSAVGEAMASIPEKQRLLITSHDAFAYFSRMYKIPVESIQGVTTDSEPGVADIDRIVSLICDRQLPAIFTESSVNDRGLRAVTEGVRARGHRVELVGPLYTDALGEPGTAAGTYLGMMVANARLIASTLGGSTTPLDALETDMMPEKNHVTTARSVTTRTAGV